MPRILRYARGMHQLHRVARLELRFANASWPFAEARRAEITTHFEQVRAAKPKVWNGKVLLCSNPRAEDDCFRAEYFETDFASFLAWRDWGFPDKSVFNAFGSGALCASDGAFMLGRMSAHTANAGRVYFPAGTPDPNDVVAERVDLAASVMREVEEEVGLSATDYVAADDWTIVTTGQVVGCFRLLTSPLPAKELQYRIEAYLRAENEPELDSVRIVRRRADLDSAMPQFIRIFLEDALST